jgi:hypothetical protein
MVQALGSSEVELFLSVFANVRNGSRRDSLTQKARAAGAGQQEPFRDVYFEEASGITTSFMYA